MPFCYLNGFSLCPSIIYMCKTKIVISDVTMSNRKISLDGDTSGEKIPKPDKYTHLIRFVLFFFIFFLNTNPFCLFGHFLSVNVFIQITSPTIPYRNWTCVYYTYHTIIFTQCVNFKTFVCSVLWFINKFSAIIIIRDELV